MLLKVPKKWKFFDSIVCKPISVHNPKKMKILKRGWKNLIEDPSIFLNSNKQTIKLHFDMHHGFGVLDKAIDQMQSNDREEFRYFVNTQNKFNPHIMFIAKPKIIKLWFSTLFPWLEKCEKTFGFKNLKGYETTRIYAYLAERYQSFWFKKYTKFKEHPWIFVDQ